MTIHFLSGDGLLTLCGTSTAGREHVAVTDKKRDVTCVLCKMALS